MPLEVLIGVRKNEVLPTVTIKNKPAEFLWGMKYTRETPSSSSQDERKTTYIELVYEGQYPRLIEKIAVKLLATVVGLLGYPFEEDPNSKALYLLSPSSLEQLKPGYSIPGVVDGRWVLFGSKKLYKAFFRVLNEDKINGLITDEDYIQIFNRINARYNKYFCELGNAAGLERKLETLKEFKEVFRNDPLIRPYINIAKLNLADNIL